MSRRPNQPQSRPTTQTRREKSPPQAARQTAKRNAITAAEQGTFGKTNRAELRKANVNPTKIREYRDASKGVADRNARAAAATTGNSNINSAIDAQFNSGLNIGRNFYNTQGFQDVLNQNLNADGTKMSEAQVAKYAMDKGFGLGDQYMTEFGTTTAPRKAANIRQAIKIAAVNDGVVDRKEAKGIYSDYQNKKNLDGLKFTGILDKMNANFDKRGYQSIGLGGGTMNFLENNIDPRSRFWTQLGDLSPGGLSSVLMGMSDSFSGSGRGMTKVPGTGKFKRGDTIYGQYSTGQFKDSPGLGRAWKDSKWATPETITYKPFAERPEAAGADAGADAGASNGDDVPGIPEPEKEKERPDSNQTGSGAGVGSTAPSFRSAKSNRARLKVLQKGLATFRAFNPNTGNRI